MSTSYPLTNSDISGTFVLKLAQALSEYTSITVITPADDKDECISNSIIDFRYAPRKLQVLAHQPGGIPGALNRSKWNALLFPFFFLSMAANVLRVAFRVDVIHANWSITGVICGLIGKLTNTACITTLRGEDVARLKHSALSRWIAGLCVILNDTTVCVSVSMLKTVVDLWPRYKHKILHIPNGVDVPRGGEPIHKSKRDKQEFRILAVGSLIPRKDFATLIRAVSESNQKKNISVKIIGDGFEKLMLEKLIRDSNMEDRITLAGVLQHDEVLEQMRRSDLFILTSRSEGRPNVLLEAMATGLPVICSDIEGVRELIDNNQNGLLFEKGNHIELTQKIEFLLSDSKQRVNLGINATKKISESGLTWQSSAEQYFQLYKRIVK